MILMLTHYTSSEDLVKMLKNVSLSNFLSSILTRQEQHGLISNAFYYVKLLIKEFPIIYHIFFETEGVVHEMGFKAKQSIVGETQQDRNNTNLPKSGTMAIDTENKQEGDEEDERKGTAGGSNQGGFSLSQRQFIDRGDLKNHCTLPQASRAGCHLQSASRTEKGLSRGNVRKYTFQLTQGFIPKHLCIDKVNANGVPLRASGSTLKEIPFIALSLFLKNSPIMFDSSSGELKIDYVRESTGQGPTLEFHAPISKEFSKYSNDLWRGSGKSSIGHVDSINCHFPKHMAKWTPRSVKKIIQLFKTFRQFVAKAMLYFRIIGILFNPSFFKGVLVKFIYRRQHSKRLLQSNNNEN